MSATALLTRALVLILFLLTHRTPSIASTSALGQDSSRPKPSKRGLPTATVRVAVAQAAEKEGDAPRHLTPASVPARSPEPDPRSRITAPEYLKPYTPSRTDSFLWPPVSARATFL
jgi:hypothetical protein